MESKHPSDAANLRPALPARSFVFVFHNFPAVFLYLCTYLISLELHPDLYQVVNVRELHHNCSSSSLDLRRKHLKLESWISMANNIRHHENNNFTLNNSELLVLPDLDQFQVEQHLEK